MLKYSEDLNFTSNKDIGPKDFFEMACKLISVWCPLPSRIMDLGCGDGILVRMLLAGIPRTYNIAYFSEDEGDHTMDMREICPCPT